MNHATQVELIRRFFDLRDRRTTTMAPAPYHQPTAVYTDPERAEAEAEALFRRRPQLVALSGDLPDTGSYYATECAGVPLLLVRGEDGVARGLLNICRHRGGRVACGRGQPGRAFKCPYHSWAYDLDGALLGQPLAKQGFAALDRADFGLLPVPVAERYGLIFAAPGADGDELEIDVTDHLSGLGPELAEFGLEDLVFVDQRSGTFEANWKLLFDTFLESYHIFSLHKESLAPSMLSTPLVWDAYGPHSRAVIMSRRGTELAEQPEAEWQLRRSATVVYTMFPGGLLNFPHTGQLERWEVYPEPDTPHRSRAVVTLYAPSARAHETAFWERNLAFAEKVVFTEDFAQQEDIHRSLRSGRMPEVVYGRNEPALIHHHASVARALQPPLASAPPISA